GEDRLLDGFLLLAAGLRLRLRQRLGAGASRFERGGRFLVRFVDGGLGLGARLFYLRDQLLLLGQELLQQTFTLCFQAALPPHAYRRPLALWRRRRRWRICVRRA